MKKLIGNILKFIFEIRSEGYDRKITLFGFKLKFSKISQRKRLYLETRLANSVVQLHSKTFPAYKNINEGKDVVIVATGPSFLKYKAIDGAIHIGLNGAVEQDKVALDYLFVQDFTGANAKRGEVFVEYKKDSCQKFFGIVPYFERSNIPQHIVKAAKAKEYYASEEGFFRDLNTYELPSLQSVAFPALSFALWTHPRRIYLVGCDCTNGYFNSIPLIASNKFSIKNWLKAKKFADIHYPDVEIISINPIGLKGIFKDEFNKA